MSEDSSNRIVEYGLKKLQVVIPDGSRLEPRRRPGRERVEALLQAASASIAERGFEAATMAEIAARAGAQIGSLYRFFPSKPVLADAAFIQRYDKIIDEAFTRIEHRAASMPIEELADALLYFMVEILGELKAMKALLEGHADPSEKWREFRETVVRRIARILRLRAPRLRQQAAEDIAVVLLYNMKAMKELASDRGGARTAASEFRQMDAPLPGRPAARSEEALSGDAPAYFFAGRPYIDSSISTDSHPSPASRAAADSEGIAHADPVVPVFDGPPRLAARLDHLQLRQRHRERPLAPIRSRRTSRSRTSRLAVHPHHLDLRRPLTAARHRVLRLQRGTGLSTSPRGRSLPADGPLALVVGVDHDLHRDPILAGLIPLRA